MSSLVHPGTNTDAASTGQLPAPKGCVFHGGSIWWRGSNPDWTWMHPDTAERLYAAFAADPGPYAKRFAADLSEALSAYHEMEIAA